MKTMRFTLLSLWVFGLVTGCGGGGGPSQAPGITPGGPPAGVNQSPGGIWAGLTASGGNASFYVTEDGRLWSITPVDATTGPTFGAGSLRVTNGNAVRGGYEAKGILPDPVSPSPGVLTCELNGTITERARLTLDLSCSDANGPLWDDSVTLLYQSGYTLGSDLATIAGNYTLAPLAATNMLNIAADGTVFGMYANGPSCTVNGQVSLIDPAYNLYDVNWTFSNCLSSLLNFEGAGFNGIATMTSDPVAPAGSFYLLMTGAVDGQFRAISVVYEPT